MYGMKKALGMLTIVTMTSSQHLNAQKRCRYTLTDETKSQINLIAHKEFAYCKKSPLIRIDAGIKVVIYRPLFSRSRFTVYSARLHELESEVSTANCAGNEFWWWSDVSSAAEMSAKQQCTRIHVKIW